MVSPKEPITKLGNVGIVGGSGVTGGKWGHLPTSPPPPPNGVSLHVRKRSRSAMPNHSQPNHATHTDATQDNRQRLRPANVVIERKMNYAN